MKSWRILFQVGLLVTVATVVICMNAFAYTGFLDVSKTNTSLTVGGTSQVVTHLVPDNGVADAGNLVESSLPAYTSSNPAVATVDEFGLITAVSLGVSKVTATYQGKSASITIIVYSVRRSYESYESGSIGTYKTNSGKARTGTWSEYLNADNLSSANAGKYTLDTRGTSPYVKTNSVGELWFYDADMDNFKNAYLVTADFLHTYTNIFRWMDCDNILKVEPSEVTGDYIYVSRKSGWRQVVADYSNPKAISVYLDGELIYYKTLATAHDGFAYFQMYDAWTGSILNVYVDDRARYDVGLATSNPLAGVTISKQDAIIFPNQTLKLSAKVNPVNSIGTISWASSDQGVATVDQNGNITAVAAGTAVISAASGSLQASCTVTVTDDYSGPYELYTYQTNTLMQTGQTSQIIAKRYYANGAVLDSTGTLLDYKVSNPNVISVSESGLITPLSKGISRVEVSDGNKTSKLMITVYNTLKKTEGYEGTDYFVFKKGSGQKRSGGWSQYLSADRLSIANAGYISFDIRGTSPYDTAYSLGEAWFYDEDISSPKHGELYVVDFNATLTRTRILTWDASTNKIIVDASDLTGKAVNIDRKACWRQMIFDYSNPYIISIYLDGELIYYKKFATAQYGFAQLQMRDPWADGSRLNIYFDDLSRVNMGLNTTIPAESLAPINNVTIKKGNTRAMSATIIPANYSSATLAWASSNPNVASINASTGVLTAVSAGTAQITVSGVGNPVTFDVTVQDKSYSISSVLNNNAVSCAVTNADVAGTATVILVAYDSNKKLCAIKAIQGESFKEGETKSYTMTANGAVSAIGYIWNNLNDIKPLN